MCKDNEVDYQIRDLVALSNLMLDLIGIELSKWLTRQQLLWKITLLAFDKKWSPHFTFCSKNYPKFGWNYGVPSLIKVIE
jgi:hypothetical protein